MQKQRQIQRTSNTANVGATKQQGDDGPMVLHWEPLIFHLAHELAPRFPDFQLHVNLHGYDALQRLTPSQALDRFLRALGVAGEALPTEVEEQASMFRALLHGKRGVMVLDNASSADQVRPLLPGTSACPVLVTSRGSLGGLVAHEGARLLRLDVLGGNPAYAAALGDAAAALHGGRGDAATTALVRARRALGGTPVTRDSLGRWSGLP